MAYDTLKAEIRQYIQTNGANEITGQILQNVLLDMVNAYPSLDGYATQQWVHNQNYLTSEELSGYATKIWVEDHGYVTSVELSSYATHTWVQSQLNGYLPLTGGTLTGGLNISDGSHGYAQLFVDEDGLNIMTGSLTGTQQLYTGSIYSDGTIEATGNITGFSFIKDGGTSSQFLKADGSVDNNTYLSSADISGYATQAWVNTQLGGYLPLTGGNLNGNLSIYGTMNIYSSSIEWNDNGDYCRISFDDDGITVTAHGTGYVIANEFIQTSDIRRKNIISDISMAIDDIAKAPMFRFTMKDDDEDIVRVGTSAQYWQSLIPELISENKDGVLGMQYDVAAMAGVTTVAKVVVDHEQRIAELEKENALLKARLNIN